MRSRALFTSLARKPRSRPALHTPTTHFLRPGGSPHGSAGGRAPIPPDISETTNRITRNDTFQTGTRYHRRSQPAAWRRHPPSAPGRRPDLASGPAPRRHRRARPAAPGVYRTGPVVAPRAAEMAATLACGPNAALSHGSAARMWGLASGPVARVPIEVGLRQGYRRRPGIRIHRLPSLRADDVTRVEGIPVTTAARVLWDLAASSGGRDLERSYAAGLDRGLFRPVHLEGLLDRHSGAPGSRRLRALLNGNPTLTRSAGGGATPPPALHRAAPGAAVQRHCGGNRSRFLLARPSSHRGGGWIRVPRVPRRLRGRS